MNLALYMARRLHGQQGAQSRASRLAVGIATAGVTLGIAVMIVAVCVVVGFKREVQSKVTGLGCHVQVLNYESLFRPEYQSLQVTQSLLDTLRQVPHVLHAQRFCQKGGMLKTERAFQGTLFKGIEEDYDLAYLRSTLTDGQISEPFSATEQTGRIVLSQMMARQLGVTVGSKLYAYFFDGNLRARRFTVTAIYSTHLTEYDSRLVFCDYAAVHQLLGFEPDQASGVELTTALSIDELPAVAEAVANAMPPSDDYQANYAAATIRTLFPHFFSWLDLLDVNVVVILLLMLAVAAFTTVSGLLIIILERTQFIGVMKALGATNGTLRHLFLCYASLIVLRGLALGNLLGLSLCFLQQRFSLVRLDADYYYVDAVPIHMAWPSILMVNILITLLVLLVLVLPTYIISRIHPARSIRFE